jgi:uncharacterized protein YndB with AHSA1/START domain
MLTTIAIVVVLLILVVLIVAATQPDVFRAERAISITAPPDQVFALINDFRRWDAWSPWDKKDPAMKRTYGATASGKGANYAWEGNKDIGKGSMEITDSVPPSRIQIKLEFLQPFEAHNIVSFTLEAGAARPRSRGRWKAQYPTSPRLSTCSATRIAWSARILRRGWQA